MVAKHHFYNVNYTICTSSLWHCWGRVFKCGTLNTNEQKAGLEITFQHTEVLGSY